MRWGVWLPRFALVSGVVALLGLAAINPDAWIAERNLDRYADTGRVDWHFLRNLSADAVPVFDGRSATEVLCGMPRYWSQDDDWLSWNLGRSRASDARRRRPGGDDGGPGDGAADVGRPHGGRLPRGAPDALTAGIVPDRCVGRTGRRPTQTSRTIPASGRPPD